MEDLRIAEEMYDLSSLTPRQRQIFGFLFARIRSGHMPTIRDIGDHFGITSPNGVMCHLVALGRKGMIRRTPHVSRSIRLAPPRDGRCVHCGHRPPYQAMPDEGATDEDLEKDLAAGVEREILTEMMGPG